MLIRNTKTMFGSILKLLLCLIFAGWVSVWVLKPTDFWTRRWKEAEENASGSVFGYNGLDFVVYTFPLIALAIIGFLYMERKQREPIIRQRRTSAFTSLSSPVIVNHYVGILSTAQILASSLFIMLLVWTFYVRISNDFKKTIPIKSFKLNPWQYKLFRIATRCGLLSEACLALLLLPVLRAMSVFRLIGVQFEVSVRYHIWLGTALVFFATLHGVGTLFIWGIKHRIQDEMWKWQRKGRIYLAGELALATGLVIFITALPVIRRKWFRVFYYAHHLYIVFLVMFLFHGGDRHFYMVFPGVFLFGIDKLLRVIQSRQESCVVSARVFPCKAIELTLPKDPRLKYAPTSVMFLKIPSISKLQWHPFTVTSSSSIDEQTISILIRSEGHWTSSLHNKILDQPDSEADQNNCIPVSIEGPYGPVSLDFIRHENLLMVAGGIGVTPFLSIIREISKEQKKYPQKIQLIYIIKKSQDACMLDPILPQLLDIEQFQIKLKIFVTRENQTGATLREVLNCIPETRTMNFCTTGSSYAVYGSERLPWLAAITAASSIMFLLLLVFFNRFVISPAKKMSEHKSSSSQIDLVLMCCFAVAMVFGALMAVIVRWKRVNREIQLFSDKQRKGVKQSSVGASRDLDAHEIHFGGRPDFQDILSNFARESGGSDIGVLVCGPESMKESVALACRQVSEKDAKGKRPHFNFHSLNFTL